MRRDRLQRASAPRGGGIKRVGYACIGVTVLGLGYVSFHKGGETGVPVVLADTRPIRVKPADPGGMDISQMGNLVFSGDSDDDSQSRLTAPAELPNADALRAAERNRRRAVKSPAERMSVQAQPEKAG